jgi:hypothetical protein
LTSKETKTRRRPMNVYVRRGSKAEKAIRTRSGSPIPEAIAPGLPASPDHDLKYQGGKTIQNLRFMNFYLGGDAWNQSDMSNIDKALAEAMSDQNLNNVVVQYFQGPITSNFDGSQTLSGPAPQVISQGDVEQLVVTLYKGAKLATHDLTSTVFNFMLPPGTVLNTDTTITSGGQQAIAAVKIQAAGKRTVSLHEEADSLNGLGGYHGSVHVSSADVVYYAVGVYSQTEADGTVNGIPVFDQPWKNVVATFYHELNEARSDADVELTDNSGTVPVQFMYSDAVHGPEGPIANPNPPVKTS